MGDQQHSEEITVQREREGRKDELKSLFKGMESEKRKTLLCLVKHFDEVQKHEDKNLMGAQNLAIVFGPTLSRVNPLSKDLAADMEMQNLVVRLVIEDTAEWHWNSLSQRSRTWLNNGIFIR